MSCYCELDRIFKSVFLENGKWWTYNICTQRAIDILIYEVNTVVYDKINVLIQRIDVIYIYTHDNYLVDKYI